LGKKEPGDVLYQRKGASAFTRVAVSAYNHTRGRRGWRADAGAGYSRGGRTREKLSFAPLGQIREERKPIEKQTGGK